MSPVMRAELTVLGPERISYDDALALQVRLRDECIRNADDRGYLLLVEHPPTITLGVKGRRSDILAPDDALNARGVCVRECSRGGEVTFHGPGQLVAYPIMDLRPRGRSLRRYLRSLESWMMGLCGAFGLAAGRRPPHTGVRVAERKIASIGIAARRWVTYHGVALNVSTDMSWFDLIVPCGLSAAIMTSMEQELSRAPCFADVAREAARRFGRVFDVQPAWAEGLRSVAI